MVETGRGQGNLEQDVQNSARELLRRSLTLTQGALQALEQGDNKAPVSAALQLAEGLNHTVRLVVDGNGQHVIFSKEDVPVSVSRNGARTQGLKEYREGQESNPFGELLVLEIKKALGDKQTFSKEDLKKIVGRTHGAKGIINSEDRTNFDQQQAISLLQTILAKPNKKTEERLVFTKSGLLTKFFYIPLRKDDLEHWSTTARHDWEKNPQVDFTTAMQIRGLAILKKYSEKTQIIA